MFSVYWKLQSVHLALQQLFMHLYLDTVEQDIQMLSLIYFSKKTNVLLTFDVEHKLFSKYRKWSIPDTLNEYHIFFQWTCCSIPFMKSEISTLDLYFSLLRITRWSTSRNAAIQTMYEKRKCYSGTYFWPVFLANSFYLDLTVQRRHAIRNVYKTEFSANLMELDERGLLHVFDLYTNFTAAALLSSTSM